MRFCETCNDLSLIYLHMNNEGGTTKLERRYDCILAGSNIVIQ